VVTPGSVEPRNADLYGRAAWLGSLHRSLPIVPRLGPGFWKLWAATAISRTGDGMTMVALPLMAAHLSGDVRHVAGVYAASVAAWIGLPLLAGVLVDRLDRRRIVVAANLGRTALLAIVAALAATGHLTLVGLYLLAIGLGVGEVFFGTVEPALVPAVADEANYETANGRITAVDLAGANLIGPAAGGLLFAAAISAPFIADGASFVLGVALIASIGSNFRAGTAPAATSRIRDDLGTGARWLLTRSTLRTLTILTALINFGYQMALGTLASFSRDELGLDDWGLGFLLTGMTVGSILGGILAGRLAGRLGAAWSIRAAVTTLALSLALAGTMTNPVAFAISLSGVGIAQVLYQVVGASIRQAAVPDHLRGRVASVHLMVVVTGAPLGAIVGGLLAHRFDLRTPYFVGAAIVAAALLWAQRWLTAGQLQAARTRIDLTEPRPATTPL
jgi:MFS family permease